MEIKVNASVYSLEKGQNGFDLLKLVNVDNKKDILVYEQNGQKYDLSEPLTSCSPVRFITKDDEEALAILRHDASHLMAQAILSLYPHAKFGIGPAISEGFYYDVDFGQTTITDEDLVKIEKRMKEFSKKDFLIYHKAVSQAEALEMFKDNEYKVELIKELTGKITVYSQGEFTDLCIGPHMPSTRYVKFFKLLSLAGAYWRGDSKNKQLTRIYGTAFFSEEDLAAHLHQIEEAKKRDHRKLGKELDLFMFSEFGPGFPFWLANGMVVYHNLENYLFELLHQHEYDFIKTPTMLSRELWEISGHWKNYKDNMYTVKIDEHDFAVKPMNCPGSILVYKNSLHSYRDLPLRVAELGNVHRHEASGALSGLFRVRNFTQDDAHIYCRKDQLNSEIKKLLKLFDEIYSVFHLDYSIELSTRPEAKYIGDIAIWNESEKALAKACRSSGKPFKINPGDGAFYGPKLDFKLRDSLGRIWQCGTIQLDMNLPERFEISYIDQNNQKVQPVMLHRAIFGSLERFIGILTEHFAGAFPAWLAPTQAVILPVNNEFHQAYAKKLMKKLVKLGYRAKLDDSNEKLGYRLRNAQMSKVPFTLVIGDNEMNENLVTYRRYGTNEQVSVKTSEFIRLLKYEVKNKTTYFK